MMKHIIGQSIYQMTVMMICYFAGTKFLIAEIDEAQKQVDSNYVVSGLKIDGYDEKSQGASTHLTYCFNIFVMMQIFNFMNARKLDDEFNTFGGLKWSSYFTPIVITIFILQIMILTVGNIAFRSAPWVCFFFWHCYNIIGTWNNRLVDFFIVRIWRNGCKYHS